MTVQEFARLGGLARARNTTHKWRSEQSRQSAIRNWVTRKLLYGPSGRRPKEPKPTHECIGMRDDND